MKNYKELIWKIWLRNYSLSKHFFVYVIEAECIEEAIMGEFFKKVEL